VNLIYRYAVFLNYYYKIEKRRILSKQRLNLVIKSYIIKDEKPVFLARRTNNET
jgi:hypothetical protein